jgi:hypothetical protein
MWCQEMLPSILHGCNFDTISSFSIKNFVLNIFDQTLYLRFPYESIYIFIENQTENLSVGPPGSASLRPGEQLLKRPV